MFHLLYQSWAILLIQKRMPRKRLLFQFSDSSHLLFSLVENEQYIYIHIYINSINYPQELVGYPRFLLVISCTVISPFIGLVGHPNFCWWNLIFSRTLQWIPAKSSAPSPACAAGLQLPPGAWTRPYPVLNVKNTPWDGWLKVCS